MKNKSFGAASIESITADRIWSEFISKLNAPYKKSELRDQLPEHYKIKENDEKEHEQDF